MNVKLISYSQNIPTQELLSPSPENNSVQDLIAYCARVSNPSGQNNTETSAKLIKYLVKNKHWSPLEMVSACLEIETTRDIARQILRHRSFSFQEFSQRYANPLKDLRFETREARLQDKTNRQNSVETDKVKFIKEFIDNTIEIRNQSKQSIIDMLIAKECANVIASIFPLMAEFKNE